MKTGSTLNASVVVHGDDVTYQWRLGGSTLLPSSRVIGEDTADLTVKNFVAGDVGGYSCLVTIPGASKASLTRNASLVTKPVVANTPPPASLVSGEISWQLGASQAPSEYSVRGLPRGVVLDKSTGLVTGKPTKAGVYNVRVIAYNIIGNSDVREFTLTVSSLPENLEGTYFGEIDRDYDLNFDLGGSISAKVSKTGLVSGNLNLGSNRVRFKGQLNASSAGSSDAYIEIPVKRDISYWLDCSFDTARQEMNGILTRGSATATFRSDRKIWTKQEPNTTFTGRFNSGLDLSSSLNGSPDYPQGHGYAVMKVGKTGSARIVGRAGDGAKFSMGSVVSRLGEVAIYARMHRNHASLLGIHTIKRYGTAPEYLDSQVIGTLTWLKKPNSKRSGSSYPDGFELADVGTLGGEWTRPAKGDLLLDVPVSTADNARFAIRYGTMPSANPRFVMTDRHRAVFDKETNTYRMSAKFNAKTGAYSGKFYKSDNHPLKPGKSIRRQAKMYGVFVPQRNAGYGQFTISELPGEAQPKPEKVTGAITVLGL